MMTKDEFKKLCDIFIDKIDIELDGDFHVRYKDYWVIPFTESLDLSKPELEVGDTRFDFKSLKEILDGKPIDSYEKFEALGNIIKAIGYEIYKT